MPAHDSRDRSSAGPTTRNAAKQVAVRQQDGVLAGLLAAWTWLPLAMWFAVLGAVAGAVAGAIGGANSELAHTLHLTWCEKSMGPVWLMGLPRGLEQRTTLGSDGGSD